MTGQAARACRANRAGIGRGLARDREESRGSQDRDSVRAARAHPGDQRRPPRRSSGRSRPPCPTAPCWCCSDDKGGKILIPADKIAYVEISDSQTAARRASAPTCSQALGRAAVTAQSRRLEPCCQSVPISREARRRRSAATCVRRPSVTPSRGGPRGSGAVRARPPGRPAPGRPARRSTSPSSSPAAGVGEAGAARSRVDQGVAQPGQRRRGAGVLLQVVPVEQHAAGHAAPWPARRTGRRSSRLGQPVQRGGADRRVGRAVQAQRRGPARLRAGRRSANRRPGRAGQAAWPRASSTGSASTATTVAAGIRSSSRVASEPGPQPRSSTSGSARPAASATASIRAVKRSSRSGRYPAAGRPSASIQARAAAGGQRPPVCSPLALSRRDNWLRLLRQSHARQGGRNRSSEFHQSHGRRGHRRGASWSTR